MIITISENVRINVGSGIDWSIETRRISKAGKECWDFSGSYGSLTKALQSLIDGRNAGLLTQTPGDDAIPVSLAEFVERIERAARVVAVVAKRAAADVASAAPSS